MTTGALPLGLDPLIAEAKRRARLRRLLALVALVAVAAAVGTTYATRSSGNMLGVCASVPSGWKERTVDNPAFNLPAVVLTNFRFGRMNDFYGLSDRFNWPPNGVTVAVDNERSDARPSNIARALRMTAADVWALEGLSQPAGQVAVRSDGRILHAYVEVGKLTPATIAAANQALAGVRVCST